MLELLELLEPFKLLEPFELLELLELLEPFKLLEPFEPFELSNDALLLNPIYIKGTRGNSHLLRWCIDGEG